MDQSGGGHRGGGADLRLTAPLRPGDGGPGGNDHPKAGGHVQRLNQGLVRDAEVFPAGQEHRGQHPAGPGGGGGDDALHTGVALPHAQGPGHHVGEEGAAQGSALAVIGHFAPVAPGQAAAGAVHGPIAPVGLGHSLQHGGHPGPGGLRGDVLALAVGQLDALPQGETSLLRAGYHLFNGCEVDHNGSS